MKINYKIDKSLVSLRIDKALTLLNEKYSRVYYSNLIKENKILVNNKSISPSYKVKENDEISIIIEEENNDLSIKEYPLKLDIIYEDDDVLIINKPQGLVVHPGDGHSDDTLVNALVYNNKELSTINGLKRVGIVHRIDKDTSGLLLICKNNEAHLFIAKQLKDHTMNRKYIALVDGVIQKDKGKIIGAIGRDKTNRLKMTIDPLNGKEAITHFEVITRFNKYTLIKCNLETGRTHQIRVHMSSISHPIVGDKLYGGSEILYNKGQLLHAYELSFIHPTTKEKMTVNASLPDYFQDIINSLK